MNTYPGKFIVFEGLDGSGQTTQARLLAKFLEQKGRTVVLTKEPTLDSPAGRKIRRILDKKIKSPALEFQRLFAEDRKEHLQSLIVPALKRGETVISDRYCFSSFAYGGLELPLTCLLELNEKFLLPDFVFFLDVKPEICFSRIKKRNLPQTLFEEKSRLQKVYQNYKKILKKFRNVFFIDGEKSVDLVHREIIKKFNVKSKRKTTIVKPKTELKAKNKVLND